MKAIFLFFISFICFMVICPNGVNATSDPVGSVVAVRGDAVAIGEDSTDRPLNIKSAVYLRDTLKTGARGRLQVLFNDATIISIGPDSKMTVADYEWNGASGKMENEVKEGFFHIMGGNIAKKSPENFNTKTPIATIGIRGSTYAIRLIDDALSVVFIGGAGIHVFNEAGGVEIDRPGFGTQLAQKLKKPPKVRKFSEQELGGILKHIEPEKEEKSGGKKDKSIHQKKEEISQDLLADNMSHLQDIEKEIIQNQQIEEAEDIVSESDSDTDTPDTDESVIYQFSGAYLNMLSGPDANLLSFEKFSKGTLTGESQDGHVVAQGISTDGVTFSFNFDMSSVDPDGDYTGPTKGQGTIEAFPLPGFSPDAPLAVDRYDSSLGEFAILSASMEPVISLQEAYEYTKLGYMGIPSPDLESLRPTDVIYDYSGPAAGFSGRLDEDHFDGGIGWMSMRVNWHNNRFIGVITEDSDGSDDKSGTPFFGTINEDSPVIDRAVFLGNLDRFSIESSNNVSPDNEPDVFEPITWLTESETEFGRFYGSKYQGFGGLAMGGIVDIESAQTDWSGEWHLAGAGFRSPYTEIPSHGSVSLAGFVIGVGENMTDPHMEQRFFMNQDTSDFTLEIDKDAGEVTGSLSATDLANNANFLSNIDIGGAWGSAVVDDDLYIALLGGEDVVTSAGKSGGLKPYGNHLEPTDPNVQLAAHTTWGYWEIAYEDPDRESDTKKPFHVHVPGSMWIAGQVTSEDKIQDLIQTAHVGHYEGKSIGVLTAPELPHLVALDGSIYLDIDFSPSSPSPVTGDIRFVDQDIHLVIENGTVGSSGFSGTFRNTLKSDLRGAFFGPDADAVAGNFAATIEQEKTITGIFGADVVQ